MFKDNAFEQLENRGFVFQTTHLEETKKQLASMYLNRAEREFQKAATITSKESLRILQLSKDENGNIADAYSVASGLDYPGVGPKHCYLNSIGRAKYETINDEEAVSAFFELSKTEGIIPALESSHAIAYGIKLAKSATSGTKILINLSGRGDKDIDFVLNKF